MVWERRSKPVHDRVMLSVHSASPGGAELMALAEAEHLKGRHG